MANIYVLDKVEVVSLEMHLEVRGHIEQKAGGSVDIDLTKPHAIRVADDGKWLVSNDINSITDPMREKAGAYAIFIPTNDGKVFTMFMEAAPASVFAKKDQVADMFAKLFSSKEDKSGVGLSGLLGAVLIGGILGGGKLDTSMFSMRDPDMDDETICKPHIDALTPESKIKFFPRNDRTGENTVELDYQQYRHLLSVGMIDHCPVCTKREGELVVHEEDDHTFKGIQTYLIAADAQIHSVPAR